MYRIISQGYSGRIIWENAGIGYFGWQILLLLNLDTRAWPRGRFGIKSRLTGTLLPTMS